jgi:hypothetical protein
MAYHVLVANILVGEVRLADLLVSMRLRFWRSIQLNLQYSSGTWWTEH